MAAPNHTLVVMAGGSGTRFWPQSTSRRPKQLLTFEKGGKSLLVQTLARFDGMVAPSHRVIVTTASLQGVVQEELRRERIEGVRVLGEPQARNTAPCIYWAARVAYDQDPSAILSVMPADPYIRDVKRFRAVVQVAQKWAERNDDLITIGVSPTRPETGYGYLKMGKSLGENCSQVDAFVEKPDAEKAKKFLEAKSYLWNAGMFVWKAKAILDAFDEFMPEMKKAWNESGGNVETAYPKMTATSIDFGVMEKARNVVAFPLDCGWDDLGNWLSLEAVAEDLGIQHPAGVVLQGECVSVDSTRNIVSADGSLVTLLGVKDLIVVQNGKSILIAAKDRTQDIRKIVDEVKRVRPELA